MFADVSGFSALGDVLERRERERASAGDGGGAATAAAAASGLAAVGDSVVSDSLAQHQGPTAAEDLAHYLGQEVEKMVVRPPGARMQRAGFT